MKKIFAILALLGASSSVFATQETFTTAGPLNCTQINFCVQNTADNLFTLKFVPTYPTSAPSATGFNVNQPAVEISNANGGLLDLNIMQINLTGNWSYITQWSTWIGSSKGLYVMFNGRNASSPVIKGIKAIRFTAINGERCLRSVC